MNNWGRNRFYRNVALAPIFGNVDLTPISPISELVKVRDRVLLARHELEQRGPAIFGGFASASDRRFDGRRVFDALRPASQRVSHVGIVAAQIARAEEVV